MDNEEVAHVAEMCMVRQMCDMQRIRNSIYKETNELLQLEEKEYQRILIGMVYYVHKQLQTTPVQQAERLPVQEIRTSRVASQRTEKCFEI